MPENGNNGVENITPTTGVEMASTDTYVNEVPATPSPTATYEVDYSSKKAKKNMLPVIIIGAIVALLAIAAIVYFVITSNPKNLLKGAINKVYSEFGDVLEVYDDTLDELKEYKIDLKDPISVNADVQVRGSLFNLDKIKDDKFVITAGLDAGGKKLEATAKLEEDGKNLFEGAVYVKDNKLYLDAKQLFDNIYYFDLNNSDNSSLKESFNEIFDEINSLETTEFNMEDLLKEAPKSKDIDEVVKELKDILINSLNDEYITKTNEEIEINDLTVKVTKVSYEISKSSFKDLMTTFSESVLDNSDLISKIAKLLDVEKDEVKDLFKELKDKDTYEGFEGSGELNIYFNGLIKKAVGVELDFDGTTMSYSYYKDNLYAVVKEKESDTKLELIGVGEKDTMDITVKFNKEKIATAKIKENKKDSAEVEFNIDYEGVKLGGSVKAEKVGDKGAKVSYTLTADSLESLGLTSYDLDEMGIDNYKDVKITYDVEVKEFSATTLDYNLNMDIEFKDTDNKKQTLGATLGFGIKLNGKVADANTSKALDTASNQPTDAELTKIENYLKDLENTKIYKFITEDLNMDDVLTENNPLVETNPSDDEVDIYADDDCWDTYTASTTYTGTYQDFYDEYCKSA